MECYTGLVNNVVWCNSDTSGCRITVLDEEYCARFNCNLMCDMVKCYGKSFDLNVL